jgi:hypothetical protein
LGSQGKQPKPDGSQPQQQDQESSPRDARKQLTEEQKKAQGNSEPESGERSPKDPANRTRDGKPGEAQTDPETARPDDVPAWVAALPPEIRDALAGGQAERIPARYRHLIRKYNLYLQKSRQR